MKKENRSSISRKTFPEILGMPMRTDPEVTAAAVRLLRASGIKASTDPEELGRPELISKNTLWVFKQDAARADEVLRWAMRYGRKRQKRVTLPPDEGTLENLDMLIYDCRQYLMIAAGEIKSIEEEGTLALEEPTNDIEKITIRLKRLKSQCMGMTGRQGLDWEHGGGLAE